MPVELGIEGERSHDIVVVGSGAAGWSAAVAATRAGANTLLIDQYLDAVHKVWDQRDALVARQPDRPDT